MALKEPWLTQLWALWRQHRLVLTQVLGHFILWATVKPSCLADLVRALIVNKVDYCNSVLAGVSGHLQDSCQDWLQSVLNSAARLVYSARRSKHNSIAPSPGAPLIKSSIADQISAVRTGFYHCLHGMAPSYTLLGDGSSLRLIAWRLTLTVLPPPAFCWHSHTGRIIYRSLNARRSGLPSGCDLCMKQPSAFGLPSKMHHRWCRSAAAWRLFCSGRPLVIVQLLSAFICFVIEGLTAITW